MTILNREVLYVQNPALGAYLVWRFCRGYESGIEFAPIPLLFVMIPMVLMDDFKAEIGSTNKSSGLRYCIDKFARSDVSKRDVVAALHDKAIDFRELTMDSIRWAAIARLLKVDMENGVIITLSTTPMRMGVPESIKKLGDRAEKLGKWCSDLTLYEISTILKVSF